MKLQPYICQVVKSSPLRLLALTVLAFLCPASRAHADYVYFYWSSIPSVVRYQPFGEDGDYVEIDYGYGYVISDYSIDTEYGFDYSQPALPSFGGDTWDYSTINGVDYAYDEDAGYWYQDSGYISAVCAEGYTLVPFPPTADLTYYANSYAYDNINDVWYDEELTDPFTDNWQTTTFMPDPAYVVGGAHWEYEEIDDVDYAYDPVIDQWYVDDGYNMDADSDIWSTCADPE